MMFRESTLQQTALEEIEVPMSRRTRLSCHSACRIGVFAVAAALLASIGMAAAARPSPASAPRPEASTPVPAASTSAAPAAADYADPAHWLCWPGRRDDACAVDLDTTVIEGNGRVHVEAFKPDPDPPIDCFYVYPTVSEAPGLNAPLAVEAEERRVAAQQFARFATRCRLFAPVYRQHTVAALIAMLVGHPLRGEDDPAQRDLGLRDVRDAWHFYLEHENHGRGVVLIGHSQGTFMLQRLIVDEIDGKPLQSRLVSALLIGESLEVPLGADVGGVFKSIPLCRKPDQTGCAIAYSSFRANLPPPPDALFGRPRSALPGMVSACTNPAALAGGSASLQAYFPTQRASEAGRESPPTWVQGTVVGTPFVSLPGLLSAECVSDGPFNYLAVTVHGDPSGPRATDIPGDVMRHGRVRAAWGLHPVDVNLTQGNLLELVGTQSRAWLARQH